MLIAHSSLIAVAVVRRGDAFLVGVRPAGSVLAGHAEFPGGKVRPGETLVEAAERECREETGIEVDIAGELLAKTHRYDHGEVELHFFDCRPRDEHATPASPFRWVSRAELARLNFPAANAEVTKLLLKNAAD